jgi:TRAP-type uncharacterized transport system fused permease subunit
MTDPAPQTPENLFDHPAPTEEFQEHGHTRNLGGWALRAVTWATIAFSAYQLMIAGFAPLSSLVTRSVHVGFLLLITFLLYPIVQRAKPATRIPWYDWGLALVGFGLAFYQWIFEADLIQRAGDPTLTDLVVGTIVVVLVFEAARRILGLALPIVCGLFLLYGLFGQYLPGDLAHRGYTLAQIVDQLGFGTEGIYGIPTLVSATYIFLFILFGSFLEHAGMIRLFNIPLMKRFGYTSVFAGAVEATASMGGQIMPPVMGAVAFIMAETLNVPYADIVKAAVIPAFLYYFTAFVMVHLEAGRLKLLGIPKDQCPNPWTAIRESWYLILPLAALVFMLFEGFTPMFAGMMGLALTAILILGSAIAARISQTAFRVVFWFAMGLAAASFAKWGIQPVMGVIAALAIGNLFVQGGKKTLHTMKMSLVGGAKQALPVGVACAVVGVIIGILTLTGAASSFAGYILTVGQKSLFASLFLTMVVCLILGMGIPTIPNYIITSSIAAPALLKLGVPLIVSHMFVFYFGIMADLTPPVALAAFAAASIARASPMKIGFKATQIAVAGFVVPYMAVYDPALMLQGHWTVLTVAYVAFKALLAISLWAVMTIGYLWQPVGWFGRLFAFSAAALLVAAVPFTDQIGFAMAAAFILWQWLRNRLPGAVTA